MDMSKFALKRIAVWLVAGLLVGGLAADLYWRGKHDEVARDLDQLKARQNDQAQRLEELKRQLATAEEEAKQLGERLKAEQTLRHRLEQLVSRGRK